MSDTDGHVPSDNTPFSAASEPPPEHEAGSPPASPAPGADAAGEAQALSWRTPPAETPASFTELRVSEEIARALGDMGFVRPTPVQAAVYQPILDGYDIMVQSRTGSGKTVAYGMPLAELLNPDLDTVQALVLCPTRELALQVSEELGRLYAHKRLRATAIYGGAAMGPQLDELEKGVQVVVGTPGRVLDHIRRGTLDLKGLRVLLLDEADEMLSMGFSKEVDAIVEACPKERQGLLFSATIPDEIRDLGRRTLRSPDLISLSDDFVGVAEIDHVYYMVEGLNKPRELTMVIEAEQPESALIFCNTRENCSFVAAYLRRRGYDAEALSGDYSQRERERVMGELKAKRLQFVVATDVAARGIDVALLSHVINYELPEQPEVYIHRTGRTGRAGRRGVAVAVVAPANLGDLMLIRKVYKLEFTERKLPDAAELLGRRLERRTKAVRNAAKEAPVGANDDDRAFARALLEAADREDLVAALVRTAESAAAARDASEARAQERGERGERGDERRGREGGRDRDRDRGGRDRGGDRDRGGRDRDRGGRERDRGGRDPRSARGDRGGDRWGRGDEGRRREQPPEARRDERRGGGGGGGGAPRRDPLRKDGLLPAGGIVDEYRRRSRGPEKPGSDELAARAAQGLYDDELPPDGFGNAVEAPPAVAAEGERLPDDFGNRERGPDGDRKRRRRRGRGGRGRGDRPEGAPRGPSGPGAGPESAGGGQGAAGEVWMPVTDDWAEGGEPPPGGAPPAEGGAPPRDREREPRRMATVTINLGRTDDVRASEVARLVRQFANIGRRDLGRVQVRESATHVGVRIELADGLVQALEGKDYKGKALKGERLP